MSIGMSKERKSIYIYIKRGKVKGRKDAPENSMSLQAGKNIFGRSVTEKNASIDQRKKNEYKIFKY
jgi:hypothetical protein